MSRFTKSITKSLTDWAATHGDYGLRLGFGNLEALWSGGSNWVDASLPMRVAGLPRLITIAISRPERAPGTNAVATQAKKMRSLLALLVLIAVR